MASSLTTAYLVRLGLSETDILQPGPTLSVLQIIQERHLERIPFENTAQHGNSGGLPTLDLDRTAQKVLHQDRGGFCFELNGLLGAWLSELGYGVSIVPAMVHTGESFRDAYSHIVLLVRVVANKRDAGNDGDDDDSCYLVDVGFGEPPLQPLRYSDEVWGVEQRTCEGMRSRLDRTDNNGDVVLSWYKDGAWRPRLKWSFSSSSARDQGKQQLRLLHEFQEGLDRVLESDSIFSKKLIVCRLTRKGKYTLAGHSYKVTEPRGFTEASVTPVVKQVDSNEDARRLLDESFGIPFDSTLGLDLNASRQADPNIWSQM